MKKLLIKGVLLSMAIIAMGTQTGFAWETYEGGCQACHGSGFSSPLHTIHTGQSCTICHPGTAGTLPIPNYNCAGCHPPANPGVCPLINESLAGASHGETCLACHTNCSSQQDSDGDTIIDAADNCPTTPNPDQLDTYPPLGNGIGNACDCEGNFTCDADVDGSDASTFKTDFGRSKILNSCTNANPCNGDFMCDVDVDGTDASLFKSDFGRSSIRNPCPACVAGVAWCNY